ncbi:MAG: FAD-dependent oxidoreductase [Humibacillus sp.]|nr:FAD-dependent oxidoreductase [Humibacillus sp.]MDN5775954.1 FAD-dependent oxidoreductase [Humibacillus sp.]
MSHPVILTVDDDPHVSAAIARDLRSQYGEDYQVVRATSGAEALEVVRRLSLRDQPLALVAADQRMPGMTGTALLGQVREQAPDAKLVLLTAYADTDAAIAAINEIGLDHYLLKPWDPPAERLYPVLDDLLGDWQRDHPDHTSDLRVVGHRWSEQSHATKTFLASNHVPYRWYDVERDEEGARLVELAGAEAADLPLVLVPEAEALRAPTIRELATALGLRTTAARALYDVCIVGGGPAGLAAAVYAASEGLTTVVVEHSAPGGQAGTSASIENYLGFPRGLSGSDLTQRAMAQVRRFGAEMVVARDVVSLETRGPVQAVRFEDGGDLEARSVIIATGVSYRRLEAPGLDSLLGRGVYYGANASEAAQVAGDEVFVVGAANSAGQAALNLARHAKRVHLVVRGPALDATMSSYLVDRIQTHPSIEVLLRTEVVAAEGDGHLERLTLADRQSRATSQAEAGWLFVFIGASPRTDWLDGAVVRDPKGFIVTGHDLVAGPDAPPPRSTESIRPTRSIWSLSRPPFALETSTPGVFAAGDVRLDSMKRVASAVGEGAMSVYFVHRYLATM